jgi:hypothetical protein
VHSTLHLASRKLGQLSLNVINSKSSVKNLKVQITTTIKKRFKILQLINFRNRLIAKAVAKRFKIRLRNCSFLTNLSFLFYDFSRLKSAKIYFWDSKRRTMIVQIYVLVNSVVDSEIFVQIRLFKQSRSDLSDCSLWPSTITPKALKKTIFCIYKMNFGWYGRLLFKNKQARPHSAE